MYGGYYKTWVAKVISVRKTYVSHLELLVSIKPRVPFFSSHWPEVDSFQTT